MDENMHVGVKIGGGSIAVGGAVWAAFHLWLVSQGTGILDTPWYRVLALAVALMALGVWLFSLRGKQLGFPAGLRISLAVVAFGMTLIAVGFLGALIIADALYLLAILGEFMISLSLPAFGVMCFWDRALRKWGWLPLVMVAAYMPSLVVDSATTQVLSILYGVGWVMTGYVLYGNTRRGLGHPDEVQRTSG